MDLSARVTADATIGVSNKGYNSHGFGAHEAIENAHDIDQSRDVNVSVLTVNGSGGSSGAGLFAIFMVVVVFGLLIICCGCASYVCCWPDSIIEWCTHCSSGSHARRRNRLEKHRRRGTKKEFGCCLAAQNHNEEFPSDDELDEVWVCKGDLYPKVEYRKKDGQVSIVPRVPVKPSAPAKLENEIISGTQEKVTTNFNDKVTIMMNTVNNKAPRFTFAPRTHTSESLPVTHV